MAAVDSQFSLSRKDAVRLFDWKMRWWPRDAVASAAKERDVDVDAGARDVAAKAKSK